MISENGIEYFFEIIYRNNKINKNHIIKGEKDGM